MKKRLLSLLLCLVLVCANSILVMATEKIQETFSPIMQVEGICINPLYAETQTEDKLNQPSNIALITEKEYVTDETAIAEAIRSAMTLRETDISINFQSEIVWDETQVRQWIKDWMENALEETDNPEQGDSLRWVYGGYSWSASGSYSGNTYYYDYSIAMTYYTTREQEEKLTEKVNELLDHFAFSEDTSDYIRIKTIYDYICENIVYDYENLENDDYKLKYTAYAALIDGSAVCQGYAVLLYRMLEESGVDSRVISGIGNGGAHGWNIALLKGEYYNLDSTWDAGRSEYGYFLKCQDNFNDHVRNEQYASEVFMKKYPMSPIDYVVQEEDIPSETEIVITSQPQDFTGQIGDQAIFTVEAVGKGISYQWQYQNAGAEVWKISGQEGNRTDSLSVLITGARNGQKYRCVITDAAGNQMISDLAALYVEAEDFPVILNQPVDYYGTLGENAVFTVGAAGNSICYQWKYQNVGTSVWKNSIQIGNKTNLLSIPITEVRNGQKYCCVITDASGNQVTSDIVIIHVEETGSNLNIVITSQPVNYKGKVGEVAVFTVEAEGENLIYQWQYQNVGKAVWKTSVQTGNKTASVKIPITEARNNQKYRCLIINSGGDVIVSETAVLNVEE